MDEEAGVENGNPLFSRAVPKATEVGDAKDEKASTQAAHLLRANIIVLFLLFAEDKFHET